MTGTMTEADGKKSYTRMMGAACVLSLCAVFLWAAAFMNWETVRFMATVIAGLAAGLYGINKAAGVFQGKPIGGTNG